MNATIFRSLWYQMKTEWLVLIVKHFLTYNFENKGNVHQFLKEGTFWLFIRSEVPVVVHPTFLFTIKGMGILSVQNIVKCCLDMQWLSLYHVEQIASISKHNKWDHTKWATFKDHGKYQQDSNKKTVCL